MHSVTEHAALRAATWDALFERFAAFQSMPCLRASGPDRNRPKPEVILRQLNRQLERERAHLPVSPSDLTQDHFEQLLRRRGLTTRGRGKRPSHIRLWQGLWRAVILDRDDYCCYFCGRSGEEGVIVDGEGRLALRLELDHAEPRSAGGHDYLLANIRTMCRSCNTARGRMGEAHFRAELLSLAAAVFSLQRV